MAAVAAAWDSFTCWACSCSGDNFTFSIPERIKWPSKIKRQKYVDLLFLNCHSRDMREKPKEKGPQLKRDEHNFLDRDEADVITKRLTQELITTQRDFQKEISFKNAKGNRRDIVMKVIIYQRNTVNGKLVQSDCDDPLFEKLSNEPLDPYKYKYFEHIDAEIAVKEMPMRALTVTKWLMGTYKASINYLARMNVMDRI